ncbi:hypothetical protein K523DRAFT_321965 [Schizophyllum commune Tattone D]|nr:hypothetical protein K523DRAFT_321965 [Schizophyllum commune Tattone D]
MKAAGLPGRGRSPEQLVIQQGRARQPPRTLADLSQQIALGVHQSRSTVRGTFCVLPG